MASINNRQHRSIFISALGNVFVWYDFVLFAFFATEFKQLFFTTSDQLTGLAYVFSVFAVSYFMRPLGSIYFGQLGDKYGRATSLKLSILMISASTFLLGLLPLTQPHNHSGTLMLILLRMLQGFAIGGETAGAIIYTTELASNHHRAMTAGTTNITGTMGVLCATVFVGLLKNYLSAAQLLQFGWRLPFLIGGIFGMIIFWLRQDLIETTHFIRLSQTNSLVKNPISQLLHHARAPLLRTFFLIPMGASLFYITFVYLPTYATEILHYSLATTYRVDIVMLLLSLFLISLGGWCSDTYGRRKTLSIIALFSMLFALPCFYLLQTCQSTCFVLGFLVLTLLSSFEQGASPAMLAENFPAATRYSGLGLSYNLGFSVFGGAAPALLTWLIKITHNQLIPGYYLITCAVLTGITLLAFIPETAFQPLDTGRT